MINKQYLAQLHHELVAKRREMVKQEVPVDELKLIDRKIGGLAAVFNPRIAEKARKNLEKY
jgi:hypothetical protein